MVLKRALASLSFLLHYASFIYAQQPVTHISGTVADAATGGPVAFASVALLRAKDSTQIMGLAANAKGRFVFDAVPRGNYLLVCTFIGYAKQYLPVNPNGKHEKMNLGNIGMALLKDNMQEVIVTSRKQLLSGSVDRKVYDVSQDIMAKSGTAADVLKNVPSVDVDIDGQVSLRGSSGVMILINGRPSPLMGKSRADVLQQLPANAIERIEVMTNPSARYKPDGTSGIINIVLKKNTRGGWNGSVIVNAGNHDRYNGSMNLNYRTGRINVFGNYGIRQDSRIRLNDVNREYIDSASHSARSYYDEHGRSVDRPVSHLGTLGMDITPDKHNSFGISGNLSTRNFNRNEMIGKFFYDNSHAAASSYDRVRYDPEWQRESDATAYYEHRFAEEEHSLRMEVNASRSNEQEDNHYSNIYHLPAAASSFDNTLIRQGDNQQQVTLDYSNPLTDDSKLELGYAGSFTQQDFNFYGEHYDAAISGFKEDTLKTNRFLYKEFINAFYGTYQKSYDAFRYELGLRMENAVIRGNQLNKNYRVGNSYFRVYPTIHLGYRLTKGELQLNYSRRVHRPEGDDINPFPEYQDPYNLRSGNPKLQPEMINSYEFGYKWQNKHFTVVPGLYYRDKRQGFTFVTVPVNDSVLLTTIQNLSSDRSAGFELILSATAGKFFSANLSNNVFYNQIDASGLGYSNKKSIVSMNTNLVSTFTITPNTVLQVAINYRSARLTPQGEIYPNFVWNTGVRQDLFKKKLSLVLTASDLLNTLRQKTVLNTPFMKQVSVRKRDARIVYFGVSYRFGRTSKKADEKMQFDNNN
jgi:outer membrane receptor protein involved in Fe transport